MILPCFAPRACFQAIAQESGAADQPLRQGIVIGDEEIFIRAKFTFARHIGKCDAAFQHTAIGTIGGEAAIVVVAILLAHDQRVMRAAYADRRRRRAYTVSVAPVGADQSGDGAEPTAYQAEYGFRERIIVTIKNIFVDAELRFWPQRDDTVIGKGELRIAGFTKTHGIARE